MVTSPIEMLKQRTKSPVVKKRLETIQSLKKSSSTPSPSTIPRREPVKNNGVAKTPEEVFSVIKGDRPVVVPKGIKEASEKPQVDKEMDKQSGIHEVYVEPSQEMQKTADIYGHAASQLDLFTKSKFQIVHTPEGKPYVVPAYATFASIPVGGKQRIVPYPLAKKYAHGKVGEYKDISRDLSLQSNLLFQEGVRAQREWHPDTTIKKTATGYTVEFPYAGAEQFGTYKKKLESGGFGGLLATAFTPSDFLGIPSAVETMLGNPQKALDIKIQSLQYIKSKQERGPRGFAEFYIESPMGQIAVSSLAGMGLGAATKLGGAALAARIGSKSIGMTALKLTGAGIMGGMIGASAADVTKTFQEEGVGLGLGKIAQHGILFASSIAGAKKGASLVSVKSSKLYEKSMRDLINPSSKRHKGMVQGKRGTGVTTKKRFTSQLNKELLSRKTGDVKRFRMGKMPQLEKEALPVLGKTKNILKPGSAVSKTQIFGSESKHAAVKSPIADYFKPDKTITGTGTSGTHQVSMLKTEKITDTIKASFRSLKPPRTISKPGFKRYGGGKSGWYRPSLAELESLEAGLYTSMHSHWSAFAPTLIKAVGIGQKPESIPMSMNIPSLSLISMPRLDLMQRTQPMKIMSQDIARKTIRSTDTTTDMMQNIRVDQELASAMNYETMGKTMAVLNTKLTIPSGFKSTPAVPKRIILGDLDKAFSVKKISKMFTRDMGLLYRERTWKVGKIEQLFDIGM